jgi:hypothetical protein
MKSLMEARQCVHNYEGETYSKTAGSDVSRLEWIVHMLLIAGLQV